MGLPINNESGPVPALEDTGMNSRIILFSVTVFCLAWTALSASAQEEHKPYVGSEAFERMKQLQGDWEGTLDMGKGPEPLKAHYKVTSGGSVVVETVFVGTPHEMVSVYHDNPDKQLVMTHYCMEANQPKMNLKRMDAQAIVMELSKDADIDVDHEKHMHAATLLFEGGDRLTQKFTGYADGKKEQEVTIQLTRAR